MKILQINNLYNSGSTGKITYDIHRFLLAEGIDSVVCYGRGEKTRDANVYKVCGEFYSHVCHFFCNLTGLMYGYCGLSTGKLLSLIEKEKPDLVHLQCVNGYFVNIYKLIEFLNKKRIPTVLTLHAEFMHTANCGHALECERWKTGCGQCPRFKQETQSYFFDRTAESWRRMKDAFAGFDLLRVVSVSPWLMDRAKASPILGDKQHSVIYNGLNTGIFKEKDTAGLREEFGIALDTKIVFHATPHFSAAADHLKGGCYVIEAARRMPDVHFLVAGRHDEGMELPPNMTLLGNIADQDRLADMYCLADVTLLTSVRETFSMICAESLSCGTPVVGFKAGAPEQISLKEYSSFCDYADMDALVENLRAWLVRGKDRQIGQAAKDAYSAENMASQYLRLYQSFLKDVKR